MTVRLRQMGDSDFPLVNSWRALPQLKAFADELERGGEVIEVDGEPVGWIDAHPAHARFWSELLGPNVGDAPWTVDVFVVPARWNEGITRAAIRAASVRCLATRATCMVVDVEEGNLASTRAFVGAGWVIVPTGREEVILRFPPLQEG